MKSAKSKTKLNEMKTPSRQRLNSSPSVRDPVQVYCRLRPMQMENDVSCLRVLPPNTVLMSPPDSANSYRNGGVKTMKYTFKEVFPPESTQQEVFDKVAHHLVEGLIKGKNGLLFTYGVTGSGKTFTMTGEPQNSGILPRCLSILFKSISDCQAHKYVFKPDKMNMFDVLTEAEAMLERQQELHKFRAGKKVNSTPDLAVSSLELTKVDGVNEDNQYAVFVTYVEIYNNSIYDLLDEASGNARNINVKVIREDAAHNMYVHGVTEVEIKSADEAFDVFYRGLKRKRMAHTTLNSESSRSHSVFTIRLVQAPIDEMGEAVIPDKKFVCISQLSLVDLAGSERTNRTKNTGQRLREAGNINNSLMTLRSCLEALRENQLNNANKMVPYRESKITHLFKNFFDGEGQVRMVVCVNPRSEDYDETMQVMRFAEVAAEVEVARPVVIEVGAGLASGRRKANRLFTTARDNLARPEAKDLELDLGLVYSLGPDFPSLELSSPRAAHIIKELMAHLEMRIDRRETLKRCKNSKDERLRNALLEMEKESLMVRSENTAIRGQLAAAEKRARALEERLLASETAALAHQRKVHELTDYTIALKRELQEKDMVLSQNRLEKEKQKRKFTHKMAAEHEKIAREFEMKNKDEQDRLKNMLQDKENKIRLAAKALKAGNGLDDITIEGFGIQNGLGLSTPVSTPRAQPSTPRIQPSTPRPAQSVPRPLPTHLLEQFNCPTPSQDTHVSRRGVAVANPRHRRSLSQDAGARWIAHTPRDPVPLGTVMKPAINNSKKVHKLTTVKDIANSKTSHYCLISQDQDTDGELETKLYKGEIVPTCGGGAQVIFNDVEMLKQMSPTRASHPPTSPRVAPHSSCPRHSAKRNTHSPPPNSTDTNKKQRVDSN